VSEIRRNKLKILINTFIKVMFTIYYIRNSNLNEAAIAR
jgi:hypothetical protein